MSPARSRGRQRYALQPRVQLASGKVELLHLVAVTESEWNHAKTIGTEALIKVLKRSGAFPVTDPGRAAVA
jgi:hypothetical protein